LLNDFILQKKLPEPLLISFAHFLLVITRIPHGEEEVVKTVLHQLVRQSGVRAEWNIGPEGQSLQNTYCAVLFVTSIVAVFLETK
jgi:hypothetical protein